MPQHRFGGFTLDTDAVELTGPDGEVREVEPQVFRVIEHLVGHNGRLVTKEELLDNVWGDRFVSESALTTRIKQARKAVDDDGQRQWAIKTVHGRGYRFVADLEEAPSGSVVGETPSTEATGVLAPTSLPEELRADARGPFCGRRAELASVGAVVERSGGEDGYGWVWILGEPGIGKTRLAAEIARRAHDTGERVLFGRNSEDLRVPYQPFIEAMRQAAGAESRHGEGDADVGDGVPLPGLIRRLLPDIEDGSGGDRPARDTGVGDAAQRYRLFEAVADCLERQAEDHPVVMVIDDVHWAADSTLQLLGHLQRRPSSAPVTFVLTARDTAPDASDRVADLLAAAQGHAATTVVRLEGLSGEEAQELVGEVDDLDHLMRATAGNPLFLQAVDQAEGSVDLASAVRRRLASLEPPVQEALRSVSVLGLEFELGVAAVAGARDDLDLLDDLETAVAARLLDDVGLDRFRFTHALVRSTLRDELSSSRQARMHRRAADAIDRVHPDDPTYLPELAHHTAEAAVVDRVLRPLAIERLRRAAQESMMQLSFAEASDLISRARALDTGTDPTMRAELALELGQAESRAGRNMPAARAFEEAIGAARDLDDVELVVEAALRYEDASWRPGLPGMVALGYLDDAARCLDEAVADTGHPAGDVLGRLRARLAIARLRALAMSGRPDEAEDAFVEGRHLAVELGDPNVEANVISVYLGQVRYYDDPWGAEAMLDRLAELAPDIEDGDVALHALHDRIIYSVLTGDFEGRRELVAEMAALQERSHSRFWSFIRANEEAMEALYAGDLLRAEQLAQRCLELAEALPEEDGSGTFGLRMFVIRREQDRLAALAPLVRHVLANQPQGSALWTPGLALLLAETGEPAEAGEVLESVRDSGFRIPADAMWGTVMVMLIETVVQLGDLDACAVLRQKFEAVRGLNVTTGSGLLCFGRADRYLGKLSLVLGDLDAAEEELGSALEGDDSGGSPLYRNESRLWLSRARRAQGHAVEADAMAEVVQREAQAAGLPRLARLAAADLEA